jgi:prepilin-type processing-associated H-X9-DG protein
MPDSVPTILTQWGTLDDDFQPLPSTYQRLKEGAERFAITDINNPAAGARAQSTIAVMWDAWATTETDNWGITANGVAKFNHVPGGSNVLWMDGHVEFVKFMSKYPLYAPVPPDGRGCSQMTQFAENMGGYG